MTMHETFTKKQIEEAFAKRSPDSGCGPMALFPDELIAELTKPKWTPQEGEVCCWSDGKYYVFADVDMGLEHRTRPLTPDEVPALKVAIEALNTLSKLGNGDVVGNSDGNIYAQSALAKIKELTGA